MPQQGTTYPLVVTYYTEPGGPPADVPDVSLTILRDDVAIAGPFTPPTVLHDAPGHYRYDWAITSDLEPGLYTAQWSGTLPTETEPSIGYENVVIDPSAECWPVDTAELSTWDDTTDDEGTPLYSPTVKVRAMALAVQSMRLLTGFRVGGCPVTVRPCRRDCNTRTWRTYPVRGYIGSTPWWPVSLGGQWLNVSCGSHDGCSCSATHEVALPSAVSSVDEVLIDGEVLDPSAYRLDPGGRLVRTDGDRWPLEQNLNAPDSEPGTWSVTYVPGVPVDALGALCAGLLALEYAKALIGEDCGLPNTVTQVARLGVTMTLAPGSFPQGKTGIRIVDDYLTRWNPHGHLSATPSAVYNIDQSQPRSVGR